MKEFLKWTSILMLFISFTSFGAESDQNMNLELKEALIKDLKSSSLRANALRELAILEAGNENWGLAKGYLTESIQRNPFDLKSWRAWSFLKEHSPIRGTFWTHSSWQTLHQNFVMWIEFWLLTAAFLLILFFNIFTGIRFYARYQRAKKTEAPFDINIFTLTIGPALTVFIGLIWLNKLSFEGTSRVVLKESASLKTFYGDEAPTLAQLLPGMEAKVDFAREGWLFVRLSDGRVGWVSEKSIYAIPPVTEWR